MRLHGVIGWGAIVSSIGSELADLPVDLVEQLLKLRGSAGHLLCQVMSNDLATVGVNSQMQLAPATPGLRSVLSFQPLASAIDLQPGTGPSATCCCRSLLLADGFQVLALRLSVV